jgi:hypothetical protein
MEELIKKIMKRHLEGAKGDIDVMIDLSAFEIGEMIKHMTNCMHDRIEILKKNNHPD